MQKTNQLTDISALSGLTNLESLYLGNNQLTDISPLSGSGLIKLRFLYLDGNLIREVPDCSRLTELRVLNLNENLLEDISKLSQLKDLGSLGLRYNNLNTDPGSPLMNLVECLRGYNVGVYWFPQTKAIGTIYGQIITAGSGEPIDQAWVRAYQEIDEDNYVHESVYSGPDGSYEIELPPIAGYTVSADKYEHASVYRYNVEVKENQDTVVNLALPHLNEQMDIADPNLEVAIREALARPVGSLTYADLSSLRELDAASRNIRDLSGLEYADNLRTLKLNYNQISDLSPLSSLWLERLELAGNQIRDISALPYIFGYLDLRDNYLDISAGSPAKNKIDKLIDQGVLVEYVPQSIKEFETVETSGEHTATLDFAHANTIVEVSSDVELSASIYLNRYDQYHIPDPIAATSAGIYLHIGRDGDLHGAKVTIKVSYNPGELPAGMEETSLRIKRFNENLRIWEEPLPQGVNTEGNYVWAEVSDFSVFGVFVDKPVAFGDINGDGRINISDAILVLRSIVGLTTLSDGQKLAANVSGDVDGIVDVGDAILILRHIVGLDSRFPVEGPLP